MAKSRHPQRADLNGTMFVRERDRSELLHRNVGICGQQNPVGQRHGGVEPTNTTRLLLSGGTTLTLGSNITVRSGNGRLFNDRGDAAERILDQPGVSRRRVATLYIYVRADQPGHPPRQRRWTHHPGIQGSLGNAVVSSGGTLDLDGAYVNDQDRAVINSALTCEGVGPTQPASR